MDPLILLGLGALACVAAGHFGTAKIATWVSELRQGAQAAKAKTSSLVSSVESAVAHPLDALHNVEHATADAAAAAAVKAIQWLSDKSKQQAVIQKAQAEMNEMDARLADVLAKLQARQ